MRSIRMLTTAAIGLVILARIGAAQAQQIVTFSVGAINQISVSGDPAALNVTGAPPGEQPTPVINNLTSYSITTNEANKIITAGINANMPNELTLSVSLAAPPGAQSAGPVNLTTAAQNVVTGIGTLSAGGLTITYTLTATADAGIVASQNRTVTFTIISGT